jgi:hypothetical protein
MRQAAYQPIQRGEDDRDLETEGPDFTLTSDNEGEKLDFGDNKKGNSDSDEERKLKINKE